MKKVPTHRTKGQPLPSSSSLPGYKDSLRKRGSDGRVLIEDAAAKQAKAREDRKGAVGEERATSYFNSARRGEEKIVEELNREAEAETRKRSFPKERPEVNQQLQDEAAVRKLTQTKEYFAELCRNYLAHYKTQGADLVFPLSSSTAPCATDSRSKAASPEEKRSEERNAGGQTASVSAAAAAARPPPPSSHHQRPPECECRRMPSDADIERYSLFSGVRPPPSNNRQPPPDCRRMPSDFDAFLESHVLQLDSGPSKSTYREELFTLESRAILMLDSIHRKDGHSECDGTILCKAGAGKCDGLELSQFRSYQLAFKAAAVAEIVRLQSQPISWSREVAESLCDDTLRNGSSEGTTRSELVKRLKLQTESDAKELAQLRAEKTASEELFAEIQGRLQNLERQISSCSCKKMGATPGNVAAACTLKSPALNEVFKQQRRQDDGHTPTVSRLKAMRGVHTGVSTEEESRLERICEPTVDQEVVSDVVRLIAEKLETVKADMGVFVKSLQFRIASAADKISSYETRVRPIKVALFCLKLLIDRLVAKKAEIEASLVENSSDNRLGLKLHFRS